MGENSLKSVLFYSFNNFLAFCILILFAIVIFSVLILSFLGKLDFLAALEKTFLVFEGILGVIIGFYFGYHGIERAEKERDEAFRVREGAISDKKASQNLRKTIVEMMESEGDKCKKFTEDFISEYQPEVTDTFKKEYRKWRRDQPIEEAEGVNDPGVTP